MGKKKTYQDYLKEEFSDLIDRLNLGDLQKQFLRSRWLDQLLWMEGKATKLRARSTRLSLISIVGGVLLPAIVTYSISAANEQGISARMQRALGIGTFILSQAVAVSAALEQYFKNGEKAIQYRSTAETLKAEAWQFFQLTGPYEKCKTHKGAYKIFADRVEQTVQEDVKAITSLAKQAEEETEEKLSETEENMKNLAGSSATLVPSISNSPTSNPYSSSTPQNDTSPLYNSSDLSSTPATSNAPSSFYGRSDRAGNGAFNAGNGNSNPQTPSDRSVSSANSHPFSTPPASAVVSSQNGSSHLPRQRKNRRDPRVKHDVNGAQLLTPPGSPILPGTDKN